MESTKQPSTRHKEELLNALSLAAKDSRALDAFLKDILTPVEYREVINRWQILKLLAQGSGHREIMRDLKIGIATVTRGSRVLENPTGGANQIIHKLVHKR